MKQVNRALKSYNAARSDHWESQFYCMTSKRTARATAKREAKRARRRIFKYEDEIDVG